MHEDFRVCALSLILSFLLPIFEDAVGRGRLLPGYAVVLINKPLARRGFNSITLSSWYTSCTNLIDYCSFLFIYAILPKTSGRFSKVIFLVCFMFLGRIIFFYTSNDIFLYLKGNFHSGFIRVFHNLDTTLMLYCWSN